ncbi:hypothetical protein BDW42DRAFT_112082 [Aspergillus taichungensis]|uniref:Uncharacterized protein n=1 Tax=Aspergillus taichungensis TaxID=482145 RepID=A0A2J5HTB2_9EURO|nr:hypothetical protein BDW42DRAFT_112082 [Aspergillus taichungensis]
MDAEHYFDEDTETDRPQQPKRQNIYHNNGLPYAQHDQYTVAWICALHVEMAAARSMLDETHEPLSKPPDDSNAYVLGSIKQHNVVIACLPYEQYGTNNAAVLLTNMKRTYKRIQAGLMVGIGGGVPGKVDLRLGDVVVGTEVVQWDLGKVIGDGKLQHTAISRIAHRSLGTVVTALRSKHETSPSQIPSILQQKLQTLPEYSRPNLPDRLFHATYDHESTTPGCEGCDQSKLVARSNRQSDNIMIHYGAIASGNQVMRSATDRDALARELDIICFEMETAGLIDIIPCLPIRGICDYSDSHKNKEWQRYAAATAAAYAREFLGELPVAEAHASDIGTHFSRHRPSNERRQRLLDSLKFEQIDSRRRTIKSALGKTCKWFLSHPSYETWLDPAKLTEHHGFLWVSGKPGAGKSTIMKFAYERMRQKARSKNTLMASFFFNARGVRLEKSILGLYRSLLLQLLEGYPDLQTVLDDPSLVSQELDSCPTLNVLKDLFHDSILALGKRGFTCFVDALDECDEQQIIDMVQYFEDLTEESSAKGILFRVCFSSRHYPYIVIRHGIRLTLEDQLGHVEDLTTYAASRLRIDNPVFAKEILSELLGKAAGVFMWVVLVVDILNKEYRRGAMFLRKRLAEIPSDLSELFKDILRRDQEDMQALQLCIFWILYAKRPLEPKEFYHAIWSGLSPSYFDNDQIPDVTTSDPAGTLNRFDRYVIHVSKGLAETTKSRKPTVQFIHESVRDFLIKDGGLYELWPELGFDTESLGHETLKQCCSLYMNHSFIGASLGKLLPEPNLNGQVEILKEFPFLEYVIRNILYHANNSAKLLPQVEFLSAFPLSNWIKSHNCFEKHKIRRYIPDVNLIYVLAEQGHSDLIRIRLKDEAQIHVPGERYQHPLFAAIANGNKKAVAALLNIPSNIHEGVDITDGLHCRKDFTYYKDRTPLSWAAQDGREAFVKLYLQSDIDVDHTDKWGRTPLSRASGNGHEAVARLLLDNGAEVNKKDKYKRTPLIEASRYGREAVVRLLLKKGAEVNIKDKFGRTPLAKASKYGHEAVARLLIENGAEVNIKDKYGRTPLIEASRYRREALARLLLGKGAESNDCDLLGLT